jgi:predicted aspartyl protease
MRMLPTPPNHSAGGSVPRTINAVRASYSTLVAGCPRAVAQRCAATFLIATIFSSIANGAIAETKPEDLPPPPGALEQELATGPQGTAPKGSNALLGNGIVLSKPIEIPFIIEGGHLIIEASMNGGPPRPYIFDTGASHVISPDVAEGLKAAPLVRTVQIGGFGSKVSIARVIKVDRIAIGALALEQQNVAVLELPNHILDRGSRPRLAGLIGSELIQRYSVTIDYARRMLTLNSPGFKPASTKFSLPLGFTFSPDGIGHPSISAEVEGISGNFVLDTGAGSQVVLSERFQSENQPFAKISTTLRLLTPGGIGGRTSVRMGFGKQVQIGPSVIPSPLLSGIDPGNSAVGRSALSRSAGVIGNAMLANFVVTIDMPSGRVHFEPIPDRPRITTLYGVGFSLDKPDHDSFEVIDVLKGSGAERAGLRPGDRLIAIGGRAARDLALFDVNGSAGTSRPPLAVVTADQRKLNLTFSRLLP